MKIKDIYESTTSGSVASVAMPLGKTHKRGGNLLTGKKTNKKYANSASVYEGKMKQVAADLDTMQDGNFKQKYKKSKEQMRFALGDKKMSNTVHEGSFPFPYKKGDEIRVRYNRMWQEGQVEHVSSNMIHIYLPLMRKTIKVSKENLLNLVEAKLEEEDKIIAPGKGNQRKTGLYKPGEEAKLAHFKAPFKSSGIHVSDSRGNKICECENEDLAKEVAKAINCYMRTDEGVIAGGGVGEATDPIANRITIKKWGGNDENSWAVLVDGKPAVTGLSKRETSHYKNLVIKRLREKPSLTGSQLEEENKGLWANIQAKRERIKHGSKERMRKPGSKGAPTAQAFKDAAK